jgi:hypothetical protein
MLPKIDKPLFKMTWPSKKKEVLFRAFLVKEEKILLIAQESKDDREVTLAIKQILNNCIQDSDFNPEELTTFDLEYMFLKHRAKSVDNIVKLSYLDGEDDKEYNLQVNLDTVELTYTEGHTNVIKLNDEIGIIMKYPTVDMLASLPEDANGYDLIDYLVKNCIEKIYDTETVYLPEDAEEGELDEFLGNLEVNAYKQISDFFDTMPRLEHKLTYTNSLGNERTVVLSTLRDFFTWG